MPFFGGGIGGPELLIVGVIALLLFGKRLPEVAKNLGKGFVEFKKGISGFEEEVKSATNTNTNVSRPSRPAPDESLEEVTAPKFEPPVEEPAETQNS